MTAIVGGRVVTADGEIEADVVVSDGKVVDLAAPGTAFGEHLDARGCWVLPGGVDPHSHIMSDIRAAASAAALGGTTTVLSFTNPDPGEGALECLLRRREEIAAAQPAVDIGLHAMVYELDRVTFEELTEIRRAGAAGIKVFLAYPELGIMCSTRRLYELMTWTRRLGLLMQVHCENGSLIEALVAEAVESGKRGPSAFAETRPPEVEQEAVARVLAAAALAGAPSYLVHLSCSQALGQVRLARGRRRPEVFAEVCLHHLLLDDDHHRSGEDRFLVCPPLRDPGDREAMWEGIVDGTIDTVGSDHVQQRSLTPAALSLEGVSHRYGLAGIGPRLSLFLSEGLARGVPLRRLVELTSTTAAQVFGHHPGKGVITPGSDADLVVWSPEGGSTMEVGSFDDGTGDSVYTGWQYHGSVRAVLLRGRMIVSEGRLLEDRGGRYLPSGNRHGAGRDTVRR